jgi:predicted nucleic acid-binding protein
VSPLILLDSGPTGLVTNPRASEENSRCKAWLRGLLLAGVRVMIPEIIEYEIRRELVLWRKHRGVAALSRLGEELGLLPVSRPVLLEAAGLWAMARQTGFQTADNKALVVDMILAATAIVATRDGTPVVVATGNVGHLGRFVDARLWEDAAAWHGIAP